MSVGVQSGDAVTERPRLLRAEILRLRSRRFVALLLAIGFAIVLVVSIAQFFIHARPSSADLAQAQVQADQSYQQCVTSNPDIPVDQRDQACRQPPQDFLSSSPFVAADEMPGIATALGAGIAALLFLVGTTSGGADWSAKTMPALLFWESRRTRVLLTKLGVVAGLAVVAGVLTQVLWTAIAAVLTSTRGTWLGKPPDFWSQLVWLDLRLVLVAVLAAAAGYALASIIRNTGAALGVTFVYLVVVENVVRFFFRSLTPYLVAENLGGLVNPGGVIVTTGQQFVPGQGIRMGEVHLSNLRSGLTLGLAVLVLVTLATYLFRRRDLT